jgi:hypothetical protein
VTPANLPSIWRTRATQLGPYAPAAAQAFTEAATELESALDEAEMEMLGLEAAAAYSGYSPDHLRRLVREGGLPTERRGRRLYFRAGALPRKPGRFDELAPGGYDPVADARQVADRRAHGGEP